MTRELYQHDDLIDLGTASVETLGGEGPRFDLVGEAPKIGISNE
jgi:hypothetical protein